MPVGHSLLICSLLLALAFRLQPCAHLASPRWVGNAGTQPGEEAPGRTVRAQEPFLFTVNLVLQMGELTLEGVK